MDYNNLLAGAIVRNSNRRFYRFWKITIATIFLLYFFLAYLLQEGWFYNSVTKIPYYSTWYVYFILLICVPFLEPFVLYSVLYKFYCRDYTVQFLLGTVESKYSGRAYENLRQEVGRKMVDINVFDKEFPHLIGYYEKDSTIGWLLGYITPEICMSLIATASIYFTFSSEWTIYFFGMGLGRYLLSAYVMGLLQLYNAAVKTTLQGVMNIFGYFKLSTAVIFLKASIFTEYNVFEAMEKNKLGYEVFNLYTEEEYVANIHKFSVCDSPKIGVLRAGNTQIFDTIQEGSVWSVYLKQNIAGEKPHRETARYDINITLPNKHQAQLELVDVCFSLFSTEINYEI